MRECKAHAFMALSFILALRVDDMPVPYLLEIHLFHDLVLERLYFLAVEFEDFSAVQAHHMVVMFIIEKELVHDPALGIREGFLENLSIAKYFDIAVDRSGSDARMPFFHALQDSLRIEMARGGKDEFRDLPALFGVLQPLAIQITSQVSLPNGESLGIGYFHGWQRRSSAGKKLSRFSHIELLN
jgi:hypothetical protein